MPLNLTVVARDKSLEQKWVRELEDAIKILPQITVEAFSQSHAYGHVVFIDGDIKNLDQTLQRVGRHEKALFLIVPEGSAIPQALTEGRVDNVLLHPFRSLEVLGKLHQYQQLLLWDEVAHLNNSFSSLVENLYDDLRLAERLQKVRLPVRFSEVKGFQVSHRYLVGGKAGGDYFDLAEASDGSQISILMSDSSSYGLSSAVLSALMRVAVQLSIEESRSSVETVRRIYQEILNTLNPKDQLSLFYGVVSRKNLLLRYVHFGTVGVFHAHAGKEYVSLQSPSGPICQSKVPPVFREFSVELEPGDRLVFVSDGFMEAAGGVKQSLGLLERFRKKENNDTLNEFVFQVKSKLLDPSQLPPQDCTAVVMDVETRVVRLAQDDIGRG